MLLWARRLSDFGSHAHAVASPTFDIMQTMKPFSSMLYDSTVFASCKILPIDGAHDQHDYLTKEPIHTRINELL